MLIGWDNPRMDHGWLDRCRPTVPWLWGLSEGCFFCVHVLSSSAHQLCCGGMYVHAVLVLCWYKQRTLSLLTFRRSQDQAQHMFVQLLFHVKALICTRSCFFVVDFELSIYIELTTMLKSRPDQQNSTSHHHKLAVQVLYNARRERISLICKIRQSPLSAY